MNDEYYNDSDVVDEDLIGFHEEEPLEEDEDGLYQSHKKKHLDDDEDLDDLLVNLVDPLKSENDHEDEEY